MDAVASAVRPVRPSAGRSRTLVACDDYEK
ncbi:hypothetical protein CcI6DRAFT_01073 [Frankia sp. CcI6]|nr:hypothetical protein CcI6DRAFT_01073 [Frankia sp. CcI6]OAA26631.1 hypothetical protein AAY23_102935 [Frankia casuarinae]